MKETRSVWAAWRAYCQFTGSPELDKPMRSAFFGGVAWMIRRADNDAKDLRKRLVSYGKAKR